MSEETEAALAYLSHRDERQRAEIAELRRILDAGRVLLPGYEAIKSTEVVCRNRLSWENSTMREEIARLKAQRDELAHIVRADRGRDAIHKIGLDDRDGRIFEWNPPIIGGQVEEVK